MKITAEELGSHSSSKCMPKIDFPKLPRKFEYAYRVSSPAEIPSFFPLYESEAEWRHNVHLKIDEYLDQQLHRFRQQLSSDLKEGRIRAIKQNRDTTPLNLRYEWAARRVCYRTPFAELAKPEASKGYTVDRIKRAVARIISEADLRQGT
jgi:hypothetical protein